MSEPSAPSNLAEPPPPADLIAAGTYRTAGMAFEHALVVLASGHACWIVSDGNAHRLLVEPEALPVVDDQLARYDRESARWPPGEDREDAFGHRFDWRISWAWTALVLAMYWAQGQWPRLTPLGALDARHLFEDGEVWRPATALWLHADADHVLANLLTGVFIFPVVFSTFGRLRGFLLLSLTAIAANTAVALLAYPSPYRSLGASTAIFAALGLLTGQAIRLVARPAGRPRWRALFVPLAAGLTTLALFGAGAPNVDVGAHAAGFVIGTAAALIARPTVRRQPPVSRASC